MKSGPYRRSGACQGVNVATREIEEIDSYDTANEIDIETRECINKNV